MSQEDCPSRVPVGHAPPLRSAARRLLRCGQVPRAYPRVLGAHCRAGAPRWFVCAPLHHAPRHVARRSACA
eukprot:2596062-Lingulodinium_polyedra.AAC.1